MILVKIEKRDIYCFSNSGTIFDIYDKNEYNIWFGFIDIKET